MWIFLFLFVQGFAARTPVEALVGRVGREAVLYSDLLRFKEVEQIMHCISLRIYASKGGADQETFYSVLNRYIEEELIYNEARGKKDTRVDLGRVIQQIQGKKDCQKKWRSLGQRYFQLWGSSQRPREGEIQIIRELEKRLVIDLFEREGIFGDRAAWLREARVKTPVKLYLD